MRLSSPRAFLLGGSSIISCIGAACGGPGIIPKAGGSWGGPMLTYMGCGAGTTICGGGGRMGICITATGTGWLGGGGCGTG